jgi:glycosyltransferase involved in cell wall biosynthesis
VGRPPPRRPRRRPGARLSPATLAARDAELPDLVRRDGAPPRAGRPGVLLYVVTPGRYFLSHRLPLACAAAAEGWEVHVATPAGTGADRIARPGLTWHPLPLHRSIASPLAELRGVWALASLCRRIRPDLVHAVSPKAAVFGGLVARAMGIPAVVMKGGMGSTSTEPGVANAVGRWVVRTGIRASASARSVLVVHNRDERAELAPSPALRRRTVVVEGAGVDCAAFHPTAEPAGPVTVVLPARMLASKGVREFVEAARLLAARGVGARCVLAGGLDPDNGTAVGEDEIRGWVRTGAVEWLGHQDDMPALLARSHVVCLPSRGEGLPKSLTEAAAAGRPIVATDVAGCREVVQPGLNGLLVPSGDPAALADALETLVRDAGLRARFGHAGRRMALARFDERVIIPRMLALYRSLGTRRRG